MFYTRNVTWVSVRVVVWEDSRFGIAVKDSVEIVVHTQSGRVSTLPDYTFNQFIVYFLYL